MCSAVLGAAVGAVVLRAASMAPLRSRTQCLVVDGVESVARVRSGPTKRSFAQDQISWHTSQIETEQGSSFESLVDDVESATPVTPRKGEEKALSSGPTRGINAQDHTTQIGREQGSSFESLVEKRAVAPTGPWSPSIEAYLDTSSGNSWLSTKRWFENAPTDVQRRFRSFHFWVEQGCIVLRGFLVKQPDMLQQIARFGGIEKIPRKVGKWLFAIVNPSGDSRDRGFVVHFSECRKMDPAVWEGDDEAHFSTTVVFEVETSKANKACAKNVHAVFFRLRKVQRDTRF